MIRSGPHLRVPPHWASGVLRVDHHRCVRAIDDGTTVRVMQRFIRQRIPRVPLVNHQRRRAWSHFGNLPMQLRKPIGNRQRRRNRRYRTT